MTVHGAVFGRGRSLGYRNRICDMADPLALHGGVPRAADRPPGAQMLHKLFFQRAAGLHIKASIDRLVRHLQRLVMRVAAFQPARDLLRRPLQLEFRHNKLSKRVM